MTIARMSLAFSPLLTVFHVAPPSLLLNIPELREPTYTTSALSDATTSGNGNCEIGGVPIAGALSWTQLPPELVVLNINPLSTSANRVAGALRLMAMRV